MNCYLGLGANLGECKKNLRRAIELISQIDGVKLISASSFYETEAWGVTNQPNFINAAVRIETNLQPLELLESLQMIETRLGRVRREHWGARTMDIDILLIDGLNLDSERLTVPHPFLFERDFVLVPLSEISDIQFKLHGDKVIQTDGSLTDFQLKLIACVDKNFGLGFNNQLLFRIAEDLRRFRELTIGNTIILGRKTFDSIGKVLDGRRNIILSTKVNSIAGAEVANNLESLYNLLSTSETNFVIGGGEVYRQLLPFASEIYLTVVKDVKTADVFLPNLDERDDFVCDSCETRNNFVFRHYVHSFRDD